jgi:DNA-binding transcriptional LysR family regulator
VNTAHLQLFLDLAKERSISKAAKNGKISQSAASQHLQELERQLQIRLVDRSVRPLQLTPAGQLYYQFCDEIIQRRRALELALDRLRDRVEGVVRLASIYSIGLSDLSRIEEDFKKRYPAVDLQITYLQPTKIYDAVLQDKADLGLVTYAKSSDEIEAIPLRQERMAVAVSPKSELASKVWMAPTDLNGADFVGFDSDLPIAGAVDEYLKEAGCAVNKVMTFDNVEMVKEAVSLGSGMSILPVRLLRGDVDAGRISAIRLDNPPLYRPVSIIHQAKKPFSQATTVLLSVLQESDHAKDPQAVRT